MTGYRSSLLKLLDERGYIHQLTDAAALDALASKEIIPGYMEERFLDEDIYTNKSGDPRIGTHGRTDEPGERREHQRR